MNTILFCWELGDDLGHLGQIHPIAHEFIRKKNKIFIAVKDLSKVHIFNWDKRIKFIQSPIWLPRLRKPIKNKSFAEILIYKGYHSPITLQALAEGWINLFHLVQPQIIIFDHSPTALLASSGLNIPRVILSNPFITPPAGTPPVNIRPWEEIDPHSMEENERYIVKVINKVAINLGVPTIKYVSDLFNTEKHILSGVKELDFYRETRGNVSYKKSVLAVAGLTEPKWSSTASVKIFAYVKYGSEQAALTLSILASLDTDVVCYYAEAKPEHYEKFISEKMHISNTPFDLTSVYAEADVIVSHGGIGMVHSALQSGCPMILLPLQLEQQNTAYTLEKMKIAVTISSATTIENARESIYKLFNSPVYFENAKLFSESIKNSDALSSEQEICNEIENLIFSK
jgi:UDP:flavonoid glycosyltransferase YjiC (YdhE family)